MDPITDYAREVIEHYRDKRGMSKADLASRLSMNREVLGRGLNGKRDMSFREIVMLAVYFEIPLNEIVNIRFVERYMKGIGAEVPERKSRDKGSR